MTVTLNIHDPLHPCNRDIADMDVSTYDLSGTKIITVHREHKKGAVRLL
ncbi:MAG: hypothetical protein HRT54_23345 [Colwellia sp.]|nr:hypothetical protein [Colwellia sp.]